MKRSQNWKNLYNPKNGFMQARKNGNWYEPFDPNEVNNNYTEGKFVALFLFRSAGYFWID